MASSLAAGVGCGKGFVGWRRSRLVWTESPSLLRFKPKQQTCLFANAQGGGGRCGNMTTTTTTSGHGHSVYQVDSLFRHKEDDCKSDDPIYHAERLDQWMNECITEIVSNIRDAPFLLHVYSSNGSSSSRLKIETPISDSWPHIRKRWEEGSCTPDGIILIQQLKEEEDGEKGNSKSWGLLVQGRGIDCGACYILKTNRVCSSLGFCTYFCLVRAKCYGETAELQLRNSWLQNSP
ncbi:uncharacterized protein LOC143865554 [Tasmannia lanceolata]|uniref:uncharacterized protein LOC143865554 n=1 Tax=Tasmannia lanceolata TaxID=3420 RepID=UPI0040644713